MRLPAPIRAEHGSGERRSRRGADESSGSGRLRQVLLAALLFGFAYLAWRRLRSETSGPDTEAAAPGDDSERGHPVPIDGPADEGRGGGGPADEGTGPGEGPPDDEEYGTTPAVDPSLEEVDERVEADVEETPAEPGEVSVSEDVAEAAGEEPEEAGGTEGEAGGTEGESGSAGDGPDGRGDDAGDGSAHEADADGTDESEG